MTQFRIFECAAFEALGRKTWISGPDNHQFAAFWQRCREDGTLALLEQLRGGAYGAQTGSVILGISRVERDPSIREFDYWIAIEKPASCPPSDLQTCTIPAGKWVAFECRGTAPEGIVQAEMYAFMEWLPASGCQHALAPEMEVYLPKRSAEDERIGEFWLPLADCPSSQENLRFLPGNHN
ncbi:MAG TPA: GyrI-like domain-containing protein [Anaerolineaceae bacterium]